MESLPYIPGLQAAEPGPLSRFLPPLEEGTVSAWLLQHFPPTTTSSQTPGWLIDPFGFSPRLAVEAARAGYRVLATVNNPITRFLLEMAANPPSEMDFKAALAELASSKRGGEHIEAHLRSLYLTPCEKCGHEVEAESFIWRKGETAPFARVYECEDCGDKGERTAVPEDGERAQRIAATDSLHRARALERVAALDDDDRIFVQEAIQHYLPRPLYALTTIINRLDSLNLNPERRRALTALVLVACDAGNMLWGYPSERRRPKVLSTPTQFREHNLWKMLESGLSLWVETAAPVPCTTWPKEPPASGGICIYDGRLKDLAHQAKREIPIVAAIGSIPRPNQAFWTLSVLWAGWLWGAEAALPLRNVLDRRRYDWNWHTSAIHNAMAAIWGNISPEMPLFGLLPELAPGFLSAVLVATGAAGFQLESLAQRTEGAGRSDPDFAQALWKSAPAAKERSDQAAKPAQAGAPEAPLLPIVPPQAAIPPPTPEELETAAREAIREDLLVRNEPASYLTEYAAAIIGLVQAGVAPQTQSGLPGDLLTRVQAVIARTFANRGFLRLFSGRGEKATRAEGAPEEERGLWWLAAPPKAASLLEPLPLADRTEMEVVRFMQKSLATHEGSFTFAQLDQAMCELFPGLQTPAEELVRACMESYGEPVTALPDAHRMRAGEIASARKTDLQEMRSAIESIGDRLGYATVERGSALVWEENHTGVWWFYRMASSILSRYVLAPLMGPAARSVLVLPGSRARLLNFKLRRDPRLAEAVQGWRFLKFRHLREIATGKDMTLHDWTTLLDEDPLTDEATQMTLFPTK